MLEDGFQGLHPPRRGLGEGSLQQTLSKSGGFSFSGPEGPKGRDGASGVLMGLEPRSRSPTEARHTEPSLFRALV